MAPADSWRSSPRCPGSGPGPWGRGARGAAGLARAGYNEEAGATDNPATPSVAGD